MAKVCSVEGCGRRMRYTSGPRGAYSECARHRTCEAGTCDRQVFVRDLCATHYKRWKQHRDPLPDVPVVEYRTGCTVEDCPRPHAALGLCSTHWQLQKRNGTPTYQQRQAFRRLTRDGYVEVWRPDIPWTGRKGWVREHRVVMAEALGRPLLPHETPHHINGDRADNRLCNLELWSTSQPPGQRVDDKVAWATELLHLYAPHLLADPNALPLALPA